jgi:hypothetical protein
MASHKKPAPDPNQNSAHPETQKSVKPGAADAETKSTTSKTRDARTPHDRDGNEEQSAAPRRRA